MDRLHNVMTIDVLDPFRARRILEDTRKILVPFFSFLGLPQTSELDHLAQKKQAPLESSARKGVQAK
jgi:hypothetical protein